MAVNIERPTDALFTRLAAIAGFEYATRVLEDWDSTPPAKQPSLMLTSGPVTEYTPSTGGIGLIPPLWRVELLAVIYVQSPDPNTAGSTLLNPLIAGVLNALARAPGEVQSPYAQFMANPPGGQLTTLGGLCAYARAFGSIERSEALGSIAAASIPLEMVISS